MNNLDVHIVRMEPTYVASALGFGPNPEELAWNQLLGWIRQSGLSKTIAGHRFLGFNNPSPSVGSPCSRHISRTRRASPGLSSTRSRRIAIVLTFAVWVAV